MLFYSPIFIVFSICSPILAHLANKTSLPSNMYSLLKNRDIKNTWPKELLNNCLRSDLPSSPDLSCFVRHLDYEHIPVEVLSRRPAVLRLPQFLDETKLELVKNKLRELEDEFELDTLDVMANQNRPEHNMRRADGLWLQHDEMQELYRRMQQVLTLNPAISEEFLMMKYGTFGHYAPHFDHFIDYGYLRYLGSRVATAILLVETASKGGSTTFPLLGLNIVPEKGDLILWMNADSNDEIEQQSLHAACPILEGEKVAISVWMRRFYQDDLQCALTHSGYEPEGLIRRSRRPKMGIAQRPQPPPEILKEMMEMISAK